MFAFALSRSEECECLQAFKCFVGKCVCVCVCGGVRVWGVWVCVKAFMCVRVSTSCARVCVSRFPDVYSLKKRVCKQAVETPTLSSETADMYRSRTNA